MTSIQEFRWRRDEIVARLDSAIGDNERDVVMRDAYRLLREMSRAMREMREREPVADDAALLSLYEETEALLIGEPGAAA